MNSLESSSTNLFEVVLCPSERDSEGHFLFLYAMSENLEKLKNILYDYYGEDKVDIVSTSNGDFDIIVWFPVVTVTNEYGESTTVRDLFVKFNVTDDGRMVILPRMGRSTFTTNECASDYRHSHCSHGVPTNSNEYSTLCFGTGPINSTMSSLALSFDEGLWTLFCGELDLYTKTESVAGVPYRRLSTIGAGYKVNLRIICSMIKYHTTDSYDILLYRWLVEKYDIPVVYNKGRYKIAMSDIDFVLLVSKAALAYDDEYHISHWHNKSRNYILKNGELYNSGGATSISPGVYNDIYITFKGENKPLVITASDSGNISYVSVVDTSIISWIYSTITQLVNYKYGEQEQQSNKAC